MAALFIAAAALVVLVILLSIVLRRKSPFGTAAGREDAAAQAGAQSFAKCPLCNSTLLKGENLTCRIYQPMDVSDQLCTINGCPHCYPVPEPGLKRECPVCHKAVGGEGFLVARLFNKAIGKRHVIVTGCYVCSESAKYL